MFYSKIPRLVPMNEKTKPLDRDEALLLCFHLIVDGKILGRMSWLENLYERFFSLRKSYAIGSKPR